MFRQVCHRGWTSRTVLVVLFTTALGAATYAADRPGQQQPHRNGKHDSALDAIASRGKAVRQTVIVRAVPGYRNSLRAFLRSQGGHHIKAEHAFIDAITVDIPMNALQALENNPFVASVSIDAPLTAHDAPAGGGPTEQLLRPALGLNAGSAIGTGVGVAIIDSGIYPSPDFGSRIVAFYDFTQGGIATNPYDDFGHGTHGAGLVGGSGAFSDGAYAGVAPGVNLIGLKVLDSTGAGNTSNVISAIEFATANKAALGIDVINLSLGHRIFESAATDPLVQAVQQAAAAGIVVVASSGNTGVNPATGLTAFGGIVSPGNAPSAITVGSVNMQGTKRRIDDTVNNFSSRGPSRFDIFDKPDLVAPGYH